MSKTKRMITVRAGRLLAGVCYTQVRGSEPGHVRAAKEKVSTAARTRINMRRSWQKLMLAAAANFGYRDSLVTLTYDDEHLPGSRKEAIKQIGKYLVLLRRELRRQGRELKYIYVTESRHGDGRYHHHILLNCGKADEELIRSLWTNGENVKREPVDLWGYEELAQYLTKEAREVGSPNGARTWTPSKNLSRPVRESVLVEETVALAPPPGAVVLSSEGKKNEWGEFSYLLCLLPEEDNSFRHFRPKRN